MPTEHIANVLTRYTTSLYSTQVSNDIKPTYDEFRDMFSTGQVVSKLWLVEKLIQLNAVSANTHIAIVGSWYGTLGGLIHEQFPHARVDLIDVDPRCDRFCQIVYHDTPLVTAVCADMYKIDYSEYDVVINTSCEHIPDVGEWAKQAAPTNQLIVAQSNNSSKEKGHINPTTDPTHLAQLLKLNRLLYGGSRVFPMYTRHMVIGRFR